MKKLLILFLLMPFITKGQIFTPSEYFPMKDGKIVYEKVLDSLSLNKDALFAASKKWIANNYKSAESVIQSEDKTTGQIIGKGMSTVILSEEGSFLTTGFDYKYSIQIDVKDNKCRLRVYDIKRFIKSSSVLVADMETPLETLYEEKELAAGKLNRTIGTATKLNAYFNGLSDSFKKSLAVKDDF